MHRTPVLTSRAINGFAGATLLFKPENLQRVGAFKIRGATNAVRSLTPEQLACGVATHSSGNHAAALALAGREVGAVAHIVMPSNSPKAKVAAVEGYGGRITFCEPTLDARESTLARVQAETGAEFIHPFDDRRVIAGQATCAKELIEDVGPLDCVIAPVGGGGLLSGTALSAGFFGLRTTVWAAEPEGAADAVHSFASGRVEQAPYIQTIADGLLTTLSPLTLGILRAGVRGVLTVTDAQIIAAMRLLLERMKLLVEPSGAASLAAVLAYPDLFSGGRVGVILTGGNVDLARLGEWLG